MNIRLVGNRARRVLAALVVLFAISSDAWAWGDQGHKVICDGLHSETCPGAAACVVTVIKKDFEGLSSNNASPAQKLASLKFLGHWVGDIHQPLHVSFRTIEAETASW
jgi:hypothetical protein